LGNVSIVEVTPSRRGFDLYVATQKQSLARIARLDDRPRSEAELVARATELDDAEVAALGLAAGAGDVPPATVRAVSAAVSAPLVRLDYVVAANQIYQARLLGFDAVIVPASLALDELRQLAAVAGSLHMSAVVEAGDDAEVAAALQLPHASVGLACHDSGGHLDVAAVTRLAATIDPARTVIAIGEPESSQTLTQLAGRVDALLASGEWIPIA